MQISALKGMGKSLVCMEAMRFLSDEKKFTGVMFHLDLRRCTLTSKVLEKLLSIVPPDFRREHQLSSSIEIVAKYFNSFTERRSILNLDNIDPLIKN